MTETNQHLQDFFGFGLDQPEAYIIIMTKAQANSIGLNSKETALKLIKSDKMVELPDQDSYGIKLERKNGLTVGETINAVSTLSPEMLSVYQELAASLTEQGYDEEEISELVFVPSNHQKLDENSRKIAFSLFKEASLSRNVELTNVTGLLSSRISPDWTVTDTTNLPSTLYQEVVSFMEKEQNGWPSEDEKNLLNPEF